MTLLAISCGCGKKESLPESVSSNTSLSEVKDGEYLYLSLGADNMKNIVDVNPTEIYINIDRSGSEFTADIKDSARIEEIVNALCKTKIKCATGTDYTDNYNWVKFFFEDGTSYTLNLNLNLLEVTVNGSLMHYELDDFESFYNLIVNLTDQ